MSTDAGGKMAADAVLAQAKVDLESREAEHEQLDLLEPITAEEMVEAQEALGPLAGRVAVLQEARKRRRGRPKGVRNRRTDDFAAYLSQFGPDPAVALMQIVATPEEMLVERSAAMDGSKRRLSYGDAMDRRLRAAEALMPYFHGKQPVRVDATIRGVIVQEHIGELRPAFGGGTVIDQEPLGILPHDDGGEA